MYIIQTTKNFDKRLSTLPLNWQHRIVEKIEEIALNPYAPNNNITKLQGRTGYRLRVGDWRVLYELYNDRLIILLIAVDSRGGTYK